MKTYLQKTSLQTKAQSHHQIVADCLALSVPTLSTEKVKKLYHYPVPTESAEGCGLPAKDPYLLWRTLGLQESECAQSFHTQRLYQLGRIVSRLEALTQADWIGIYRATENCQGKKVLLKEAYCGRFSRAEFPLTPEFAVGSNNSTVGLSGKAVLVQRVADYAGPYYTCDVSVQSELCVPIFGETGEVIGIIDVEAFAENFFTDQIIADIAQVAHDLGTHEKSWSIF